jgi:DNA modification methylase
MAEVTYDEFLKGKVIRQTSHGKETDASLLHPLLFPFQRDITVWAIRKGCAAIFLDTGLGKTFIQLEWARLIGKRALIIAPLSVARQTVKEALKIDIEVTYVRDQSDIDEDGLFITNYEMIDKFDFSQFDAVVLDESSILKSLSGKTRKKLTKVCENVPYRLCCTATPAPNDYTELGNHAEFLGICKTSEMLAMFFINANKEHTFVYNDTAYRRKGTNKGGQEWRLKHHAEEPFFHWLSSWAVAMIKPSDLGYDDAGFELPPLNIYPIFESAEYNPTDRLFFTHIRGIKEASEIRRQTAPARLERLQEIVSGLDEQWIVWVGLDKESEMVSEALDGAIEVKGSHSPEFKAQAFEDFQDGKYRVLVTKPRIGGFGMNFQNAHKMAFFGLNYSWEQYYQCVRRQWRYMQKYPVDVHIIMSDIEDAIYQNVMRKDAMAKRLRQKLIEQVQQYERMEIGMKEIEEASYTQDIATGEGWTLMLGDACERLREMENDSIDLSIYSPPFADLYTYTDSERDLGNSRDWPEFFEHYGFIIREVLRITKPGRLTCVHTSDIPALAQKDGYIGIKDFPGEVIRAYEREGWIFHGRAFIQKNPQAQAIRTHSKGLLFVQLRKDSSDSRPALIDQILIFKKPGDNKVSVNPVANKEMDNDVWVEWAHGIWLGVHESDTLQYARARGEDDEKHICPLQLGTIERCIKLYSNPGEVVLSPFAGIGSEGYQAVRFGRRFVGIELKQSYYNEAVKNLKKAGIESRTVDLFEWAEMQTATDDTR